MSLSNNLSPIYLRHLWDLAEKETTFMGRFNAITRIVDESQPYPVNGNVDGNDGKDNDQNVNEKQSHPAATRRLL